MCFYAISHHKAKKVNFVKFCEFPSHRVSASIREYPWVSRVSARIRESPESLRVSASIREYPRVFASLRGPSWGQTGAKKWGQQIHELQKVRLDHYEAKNMRPQKLWGQEFWGPMLQRPRHRVRPEVISTEICLLVFVLLSTNIVYITLLHNTAIKLRSVCIYCLSGFSSCTLWQTCAFYLGVVFFHNSEWGF